MQTLLRRFKQIYFIRTFSIDHELCNGKSLLYPELYLVDGGYEAIFNHCPRVCVPEKYLVGHVGG